MFLLCNMYPIAFTVVDQGELQGYAVRLELQENEDEEALRHFILQKGIEDPLVKKIVKSSDFQFRFSPIYKKFVRELRGEDGESKVLPISIITL